MSLQSGSSNCAALRVHKKMPYLVLKPILTYRPSVTSLYLDTVKSLQAKFTLNIVALSAVSEITPGINLNSCAAEFMGTEGAPWDKDCPAEFVQMPSEKHCHSTAWSCHTLLCMTLVVSGHSCFLLSCHCLPQTQRNPSFRID